MSLSAGKHAASVPCPSGTAMAGLAQPRTQSGKVATGLLRMYQLSNPDIDALEAKHPPRTATIRYEATTPDAATVISVGVLCKRR